MWHPDASMEALYQLYEEKRARQRKDWAELTQEQMRMELARSLEVPLTGDELRPVLLERVELEDHVRERIEFGTLMGMRVPAYVLLPKGKAGKSAAVLALHGHGYGSRQIVGLNADGTEHVRPYDLHGNYALELVRQGFVVMVPEVLGFGDRRLEADRQNGQVGNNSCQTLASHFMLYGISLAGVRVQEARLALDYLAGREDVDASRIGCFGFSGGGLLATYSSALDARIKATVLCAFANTFKGSIMAVRHCIDNYVPGVLGFAELPDLIGLLAPRPLFIASGKQDPIFPIATAEEAVSQVRRIYEEAGEGDQVGVHLYDGVHEVNGSQAYPWLVEVLRNKKDD
ncbi:dienelactone hydrolase family protein [Paenibacillus roseipurpureus]|uniref:Alpha/beta hydrolase family protein n=1 Tax=Paenibacillus roseopurpureus TaxID=2918901 RepID=A0AA96LR55_9BACL|nr:alpha/beta hydrolase family protein [Paenibacillus sp. MBLB1832]WNR43300.1 alpha/beta hydrolase family protein [Paenibacillus sp. MBLB1832]